MEVGGTSVDLGEAASMLSLHPDTVRKAADRGDIPSWRTPGGHRRFLKTELERILAERQSSPDQIEAAS